MVVLGRRGRRRLVGVQALAAVAQDVLVDDAVAAVRVDGVLGLALAAREAELALLALAAAALARRVAGVVDAAQVAAHLAAAARQAGLVHALVLGGLGRGGGGGGGGSARGRRGRRRAGCRRGLACAGDGAVALVLGHGHGRRLLLRRGGVRQERAELVVGPQAGRRGQCRACCRVAVGSEREGAVAAAVGGRQRRWGFGDLGGKMGEVGLRRVVVGEGEQT